jgi:preprotein translocase subunit SecG
MVQNPKGGGLSFTGRINTNGWCAKKLLTFDKSTWTLATVLILLILASSLSFTGTLS